MSTITVILNGYKRAKHFNRQLDAIYNQTIKANEILFWQNKGDDFDVNLTEKTIHAKCNHNFGVWARFAYALNAQSEYVCIFDDDTIPGKKWFENCLSTIEKHDGLLGTIGVLFNNNQSYGNNTRVGWANPNEKTEVVDIVGHCWFFKREDLATFWRELPELNQSRIVGEDMHFSYTLQKYTNKKTYVPPHPKNDLEMWGSLPETAWSLGTESVAISSNYELGIQMEPAYQNYINKGFKILKHQ